MGFEMVYLQNVVSKKTTDASVVFESDLIIVIIAQRPIRQSRYSWK